MEVFIVILSKSDFVNLEGSMDINAFIQMLEAEFEEVKPGSIAADTVFVEMKEWCSLYALIVMALVSTEFGVELSGDDMVGISTVSDLYHLVQNRMAV